MSYRVQASNRPSSGLPVMGRKIRQVYGNNEFPEAVKEYLTAQGCKFDEDGCFYHFCIQDINGFLEAMVLAHHQYMKNDSYWDFKPASKDNVLTPFGLITHCMLKIENSYAFIVYNFYDDFVNEVTFYYDSESKTQKFKYREEGMRIYLSGY